MATRKEHEKNPTCRTKGLMAMWTANETHGQSMPGSKFYREYAIWNRLFHKCYNPTAPKFKWYGAKGVEVCIRWSGENGFINFLKDMGQCPEGKNSIDRFPNPYGNYEPTNCRWANQQEQNHNRTSCRILTHNGITMNMTQWGQKLGIKPKTIWERLRKGWEMERALGIPKIEPPAYDFVPHAFGFIG